MATLAHVGIKTIQRAKHVHRHGLDEQVLSGRIVQVGALGKFSPGVRYAFEVYQVAATAESVTASGS